MFNAGPEPVAFALPAPPRSSRWRVAVDTVQLSPNDCHAAGEEGDLASQTSYAVGSRSSVVLVARAA
jgi:hypothetical protein